MKNTNINETSIINLTNNLNKVYHPKFNRFNFCQAYISDAINHNGEIYRLIKSYDTIVALIVASESVVYELGKYSRTTSKQITQIINRHCQSFNRVTLKTANW